MRSSSALLFAVIFPGVHSFSSPAAVDWEAPAPIITQAPTPTLAKRQVAGGPGTPILSTLSYAYTDLPYQVYPFPVLRGPQSGYNICNSTTLGPNSNCQTLIFNSPDDFCLWGSPIANGSIGAQEAVVVAYCTKPYHGTRVIPPDAITGLQWVNTSAYIQVTGFIQNSGLSLIDNAENGGELDPHGADLQGNPLGGVVYSNGTTDSDGHTLTQVKNWNMFVGNGQFCMKACYNSITSPDYCLNTYDLVGCQYNMPSNVTDGEYTSCDSDLQDVVGVYTTNGVTSTWSMPDPLNTPPPYQPRVPASSNCQTFQATDLFAAATTSAASSGSSTNPKPTGTGSITGGTSAGASATGTTKSSAVSSMGIPPALYALALGLVVGAGLVL